MWHFKDAQAVFTPTPPVHPYRSNVVPFERAKTCAAVNEDTATKMLRTLTTHELHEHITALDVQHNIKRAALQAVSDALARALAEQWNRKNGA